jgi:type IV secretion system protein VirB9
MSPPRGLGWVAAAGLAATACATTVQVPEIPILDGPAFKAARREPEPKERVQVVEVPKPMPLPGQLKPVPEKADKAKDDKQPKERVAEANALAKIEPVRDGYINAIQVYPYTQGALYQLYAAVNQVTDIALEPGEKLVSVSAGDTVRWIVGDTTSGEGKEAQVHILVKPIGADLTTNLVITTDRRTYHLEMRSSASTYMASVSWTYPASQLLALKKQRAEADVASAAVADAGVNIEQLKFRFCSRAMRRGSRGRFSTMASRSTSSSRRAWPRARRRRCSSSVPTASRRSSTTGCGAPPTSSTGCSRPPS